MSPEWQSTGPGDWLLTRGCRRHAMPELQPLAARVALPVSGLLGAQVSNNVVLLVLEPLNPRLLAERATRGAGDIGE
eukprot:4295670-Lingulodinium_polyedra.AAC.1